MKLINKLRPLYVESFFLGFVLLFINPAFSQKTNGFQYINPKPNSNFVSVTSNILLRPGAVLSKSSLAGNSITVIGDKSGIHQGSLVLSADSKTMVFKPTVNFSENENVSVTLKKGQYALDGSEIADLSFSFHTCKSSAVPPPAETKNLKSKINLKNSTSLAKTSTVIPDFPNLSIDKSNNPSPGCLFLSFSPDLIIMDNDGIPLFYRYVAGTIYDFKLQPNGELTYYIYPGNCYGLNSSLKLVSQYAPANGFFTDVHDLRVMPDGGYFLFGKRLVTVDMSQIIPGGYTDAQIIDEALQEFDSVGNLVFEWDALEHYKITDADSWVSLTDYQIDFVHFNTIEPETDGNIIISARNLDEITKINRQTGEIIWRFGGKNNEFEMLNDEIGFSRQHDVKRFSNGNISIFDNGVFHTNQVSSAVEYKLDEVNKTAALVRRYSHNNEVFSPAEGSVQELPNGNRLIGWGNSFLPAVTEITPKDEIAFELSGSKFDDEYRVYRFMWETGLFTTNFDTLNFGASSVGEIKNRKVTVYNPQDSLLTIDEFFFSNNAFSSTTQLPLIIQPHDSAVVTIDFNPENNGPVSATFNLRVNSLYNGFNQLIARQVKLLALAENANSTENDKIVPGSFGLSQNYPNPFNPETNIKYDIPVESSVKIEVYNVLGAKIKDLVAENKEPGSYNVKFRGDGLSSGIYFYSINAKSIDGSRDFHSVKKLVFMK